MNRIIILSYDYPPNNGGIARLCKEITKGFLIVISHSTWLQM